MICLACSSALDTQPSSQQVGTCKGPGCDSICTDTTLKLKQQLEVTIAAYDKVLTVQANNGIVSSALEPILTRATPATSVKVGKLMQC